MRRALIIVVVFLMLCFVGCHKEEPCLTCPPAYHQTVFLDSILVEPTEIDLHISTSDSIHTLSALFQVRRDSVIIFSRSVLQKDTVIVDTGLLPSHIYKYKALRFKDSVKTDSSKLLSLHTMDTTSHDFVWEVDTLGDGNSSVLFDVAIINDTMACAVGAIYKKDSSGQFNTNPYNYLIWDGGTWHMNSITYVPLQAVFAFSLTDIWTGSSAPYHWNGNSWYGFNVSGIFNGYINKIWGTSSTNLFIVGTKGSIAHYDGVTWQKMDSGTDVDLTDVWGSSDGSIVWACGYYSSKVGTYLIKNDHGNGWHVAYDGTQDEFRILSDSLSGTYTTVYTENNRRIFIGSSAGIYSALATTGGGGRRLSFTSDYFPGFPRSLRGGGLNDLMIVGDYTMIAHFNGDTWRYFNELRQDNEHFNAVFQKENLVIAVGVITDPINGKGLVAIGRR